MSMDLVTTMMEPCGYGALEHVSSFGPGFANAREYELYAPGYPEPEVQDQDQRSFYRKRMSEDCFWDRPMSNESEYVDFAPDAPGSTSGPHPGYIPLLVTRTGSDDTGYLANMTEPMSQSLSNPMTLPMTSDLPMMTLVNGSICEQHSTVPVHAAPAQCGGYADWEGVRKFPHFGDFEDKQSFGYLQHQQPELTDCPSAAPTYPSYANNHGSRLNCRAGAKPQPLGATSPNLPSNAVEDRWRIEPMPFDVVVAEERKTRNFYRTNESPLADDTTTAQKNRVQIQRANFTSSRHPTSRKNQIGTHPTRKQTSLHHSGRKRGAGGGGSQHLSSGSFISDDEKRLWERDRKKKDNHNLIERKRRLNINDKIKELGTLLPNGIESLSKDSMQNKGSILRASVDYIQVLQQDRRRLQVAEQRVQELYVSNKQIRQRLKELESFMKSVGMFEKYQHIVGDYNDGSSESSGSALGRSAGQHGVKEEDGQGQGGDRDTDFSRTSLHRDEPIILDDCYVTNTATTIVKANL